MVAAHTKSNAIVVVNDGAAVGVGAGDQSRVGAAERALVKAGDRSVGAVAASDGFFPFRDGVDVLAAAGITAIVEPGGSIRDDEVIAAANERRYRDHVHQQEAFPTLSALILSGTTVATAVRADVADRVTALRQRGRGVGLATLLVGNDPGSQVYVRNKHRAAEAAGIRSTDRRLSEMASQGEVEAAIEDLNADDHVSGMIVQLPLPDGLDGAAAVETVDPQKDADGLHPFNLGQLVLSTAGSGARNTGRHHADAQPLRDRDRREDGGDRRPVVPGRPAACAAPWSEGD